MHVFTQINCSNNQLYVKRYTTPLNINFYTKWWKELWSFKSCLCCEGSKSLLRHLRHSSKPYVQKSIISTYFIIIVGCIDSIWNTCLFLFFSGNWINFEGLFDEIKLHKQFSRILVFSDILYIDRLELGWKFWHDFST